MWDQFEKWAHLGGLLLAFHDEFLMKRNTLLKIRIGSFKQFGERGIKVMFVNGEDSRLEIIQCLYLCHKHKALVSWCFFRRGPVAIRISKVPQGFGK